MEYELNNNTVKFPNYMGSLSYFSSHKQLQDKKTKYILNQLVKNDLIDPKLKGVFLFKDIFEKFQLFDIDIMLHIQNMADQYIFCGEDLHQMFDKEGEKNTRTFHGKNFYTQFKDRIFFKDRIQITRNKFFNIIFTLMKHDDEDDLYCQMYYSGENINSKAITQRVTFLLKKFLKFLKKNKTTLHMYADPQNIIDYRKTADRQNYEYGFFLTPPKNLYQQFIENNYISKDV